jgi:hypothetical protein
MKALPQAMAGANIHIGIMAGKLNGVIPPVTPRGCFIAVLDHLQPALHVALGVGKGLAVLGAQRLGQLVHVAVEQLHERHHHPRPALRVGRPPGGLGLRRDFHGTAELLGRGQRAFRLHLAGGGVEDIRKAARRAFHVLAVDIMREFLHASPP